MSSKIIPTVLVLTFAGALALGCQGTVDPESLTLNPDDSVDLTSFDNLRIFGTLQKDSEEPETGFLDLVMLQSALLGVCYDELVYDRESGLPWENPIAEVCTNDSGEPINFQGDTCHANVCAQQLFLCWGLKNQELAEAVEPVSFSTNVFLPNYSLSYLSRDGSYRFVYEFNLPTGYTRTTKVYHYEIPPQEAQNNTLLFRAATFAFREAGIRGVLASDTGNCQWVETTGGPVADNEIGYAPASERSEDTEATIADLFAVGLVESMERLTEAAGQTVQNERSVAATLPGNGTYEYEQIRRRWNGEINSEASAYALLAGTSNLSRAKALFPPVVVDGQRGTTRRAIGILRAAALDIESTATDEELMVDAMKVLHSNLAGATYSEALEAANRAIQSADTTWADIGLARRYLLEERQALRRIPSKIADPGPIDRYHGLHEPTEQYNADTLLSMLAGSPVNFLKGSKAFDDETIWVREGNISPLTRDAAAGPFESTWPWSAELVFTWGSFRLSQQLSQIPEGVTELTFSVYINIVDATGTGALFLDLKGDYDVVSTTIDTGQKGIWKRVQVTVTQEHPIQSAEFGLRSDQLDVDFQLWGAQLEHGPRAGNLRPGIDEDVPVLSRAYMEGSIFQSIDALRQAAVDLRGSGGTGPCTTAEDCLEYVQIFESGIREAQAVAGRRRLTTESVSGTTTVKINGVTGFEPFRILRGEEGYRCAQYGNIDGADCEVSDYVVANSDDFAFTLGSDNMSSINNFAQVTFSFPENDAMFVFSGADNIGSRIGFSSAFNFGVTTPDIPENPVFVPAGGVRQRGSVSIPVDLPCDSWMMKGTFVPPLENEITQDNDPYENSWNHYLRLAKTAATEADRLGEETIGYGLDLDLRAEEAKSRLADICGASIDEYGEEDCGDDDSCEGRLASCTASKIKGSPTYPIPFVSLGQPLCIFEHKTYGLCQCDDGDICPSGTCPLIADENETQASCQTKFSGSGLNLSNDDYKVHYIDHTLGLFDSELHLDKGNSDCEKLHELRDKAYSGEYNDLAREFDEMTWINPQTLAYAAKQIRLIPRYPNHFELQISGKDIASTHIRPGKATKGYDNCPLIYPWRDLGDTVDDYICLDSLGFDCGFYSKGDFTNQHIPCASTSGCRSADHRYTCAFEEAFGEHGLARGQWADHIAWAISNLEGLAMLESCQSGWLEPPFDDNIFHYYFGYEHTNYMQESEYEMTFAFDDSLSELPVMRLNPTGTFEPSDMGDNYEIGNRLAVYMDCGDPRWNNAAVPCLWIDDPNQPIFYHSYEYDYYVFPVEEVDADRYCTGLESDNRFWAQELRKVLLTGDSEHIFDGFARRIHHGTYDTRVRAGTLYGMGEYGGFYENHRTYGGDITTSYHGVHTEPPDPNDEGIRAGLWNALELACFVLENGGVPTCNEEDLIITDPDDIDDAADVLECARSAIHESMQLQVLPNIPTILVENFNRDRTADYYPGFAGRQLEEMLAISSNLGTISNEILRVERTLSASANDARNFRDRIRGFQLNNELEILQLAEREIRAKIDVARTIAQTMVNNGQTNPFADWIRGIGNANLIGASVAEYMVTTDYNNSYEQNIEAQTDAQVRQALADFSNIQLERIRDLYDAKRNIEQAYDAIQISLSRVEGIHNEAERWIAQASTSCRKFDPGFLKISDSHWI